MVAVLAAHAPGLTMGEAAVMAEELREEFQRTFNARFGGACSIRVGVEDAKFHDLIAHAEHGLMDTLGRMAGGDTSIRRWAETKNGTKKEL